ncbi:MAG: ribonuclease [Caulobacterales bacterium]|nr:ribonuclease [Caulobacterales bacterium]
MTDDPETRTTRQTDSTGVDRDRQTDALIQALSGTDSGSDTRAGSLQGGAATGSDRDPDQDAVNAALARQGVAMADGAATPEGEPRQKADDETAP